MSNLLKNFMVLSIAMLLALFIAEIVARSIKFYNDTNPIELKYSESLPFLMVPNAKAKTIYGVTIEINSLGLRNKEINKEKAEDVSRILAVGDSTTFGYGVELEQSYPSVLDRDIQDYNFKKKYEVINMGHSGFNLFDYFQLISTIGLSLDPDIILIGIMGNDYTNKSLKLSIKTGIGLRAGSFWDRYEVSPIIIKLLRKSALYLTLGNAIKSFHFSRNQAQQKTITENTNLVDELEKILLKFASMSSQHNVKTAFIYLPTKTEIDSGNAAYPEFIKLLQKISKNNDDVYTFNILNDIEKKKGEKSNLFTDQDYVHPNPEGHDVFAKKIFDKLISQSILN